jgi:hypothetical protein
MQGKYIIANTTVAFIYQSPRGLFLSLRRQRKKQRKATFFKMHPHEKR